MIEHLPWWLKQSLDLIPLLPRESMDISWQNGRCRGEKPGLRMDIGAGIGWLVLTKGKCIRRQGDESRTLQAPAVLLPTGLPLGHRPQDFWTAMDLSVNIVADEGGCELGFLQTDAKTLAIAKNEYGIGEDFGRLRPIFCAGGTDPFLQFLQKHGSTIGIFDQVPHPTPSNPNPWGIEVRRVAVKDGQRGWSTLIDFEKPPDGLVLVLDGWVRLWTNVGDSQGEPHPRIVDVVRPPSIIGHLERPSAGTSSLEVAPAVFRVDVQGLERGLRWVHYLHISYDLLGVWCDKTQVDGRLTRHSIDGMRDLNSWLGIGQNREWRLLRWVLEEREKTGRGSADRPIWIPKLTLSHKLLAGSAQEGPEPDAVERDLAREKKALSKSLRALESKHLIRNHAQPDGTSVKIEIIDEARIRSALSTVACRSETRTRARRNDS